MAVCPFCGCKTDELDFIACSIEKTEVKICSFCEKQVKKLVADETPAAAQLRWLESVISKEVEREPSTEGVLKSLSAKYLPEAQIPMAEPVAAFNQFEAAKKPVAVKPVPPVNAGAGITAEQYNALVERIEKVEKQFYKYKKTQLIKTAIEIMAPFILLILGLIIFFASGLFEDLSAIFGASGLFDM
jgi:hypothetical protein